MIMEEINIKVSKIKNTWIRRLVMIMTFPIFYLINIGFLVPWIVKFIWIGIVELFFNGIVQSNLFKSFKDQW